MVSRIPTNHSTTLVTFGLITLLSVCLAVLVTRQLVLRGVNTPRSASASVCDDCESVKAQVVVAQPARIAIDQNAGASAPGTYPQLGYLRPAEGSTSVLPIYGRPSMSRNGRAFYYTIIQDSGIKVPLHTPGGTGRDCMEDVGCEALLSGDTVTVPDASDASGLPRGTTWTVVLYKYNRN